VQCTHRLGIKYLLSECLLPQCSTMVCTVLYPTYRTVVSATERRKRHVSCTLYCTVRFPAKGKISLILQSVQTGFWPSVPPTKGVSEAASLGIMAAAVRIEQLKRHLMLILRTGGDILPLPHISRAQISSKSRSHLKILNIRTVTQSKSHPESPQLLGASAINSVTIATPFSVICSPLLYRCHGVRPHFVQKTINCTAVQ
jgi:hypothetical protein